MSKPYNGHANYETWAVKLWMDNDSGSYDHYQEVSDEVVRRVADGEGNEFAGTSEDRERIMLAEILKAEHEEGAEAFMANQASVYADLMNAALSEVDWYEIAQSLLDEAHEREAA